MITKKQMTKKQREVYDVLFEDLKKARKKGALVEPGAYVMGVYAAEQHNSKPWWVDFRVPSGKAEIKLVAWTTESCIVCAVGSHFYHKIGKVVDLPKDRRDGYSDLYTLFAQEFGVKMREVDQLAEGFEKSKEPRSVWGKIGYRLAQDYLKWEAKNNAKL